MSECIVLNNQGLTINEMGFIYRISQLEKFLANSIFTNFSMIVPKNDAYSISRYVWKIMQRICKGMSEKVDSFFLQKSYNFFYTKFQYISCWIICFTQKNIGKFVKIKFARNLQRMSECTFLYDFLTPNFNILLRVKRNQFYSKNIWKFVKFEFARNLQKNTRNLLHSSCEIKRWRNAYFR